MKEAEKVEEAINLLLKVGVLNPGEALVAINKYNKQGRSKK